MKTILAVILLASCPLLADTPCRTVDGKVQFAVATINGDEVWTQAEYDNKMASYDLTNPTTTVNTTAYAPSKLEVVVSTSSKKFASRSEYLEKLKEAK